MQEVITGLGTLKQLLHMEVLVPAITPGTQNFMTGWIIGLK